MNDPDGGCGVDIVTSWDARLVQDAIAAELQGSHQKHRLHVVLHRSIRGPMASPGEAGAAMQDPGTTFADDLPILGDAKWSTGELPQAAYYQVRVSLRVDVVLGNDDTGVATRRTFAQKSTSMHFRVVRGTSIVPAPIVPVLVIGGGPNGISLALAVGALLAASDKVAADPAVTVLEAGDVGHFVKSWHGWTVPRSTSDDFASAEATGCKTQAFKESGGTFVTCSKSEYLQYLSRITRDGEAKGRIRFFAQSRVTSIRRASETSASGCGSKKPLFSKRRDFFQVTVSGGRVFRASVVVAATGYYSVPRVLQVPGSTLPHVITSKALDRQLHSRQIAQRVLVVGGGVSALEIAAGLLDESNPSGAETVDLSYRGQQFVARWHHPSSKLRASLERHLQSKRLHLRMSTKVAWINRSHVSLRSAVAEDEIDFVVPAETVIFAVGFDSDASFFRDVAQISTWSRDAPPDGGNTIKNGEPLLWQNGVLVKDSNNQWGESATRNLFVVLKTGNVDGHVTKQHAASVEFEGCPGLLPARNLDWKQPNILPLALAVARRVCEIETDLR